MSQLTLGIVGLPNVGKSTLFNALTEKAVPAENYPFCTIDPSVGIVAVPDERLARLTELSKSAKTIPAAIEFVDIAGLVEGASKGEGLGNQFLHHIREVDAIVHMVRIFAVDDGHSEKINHVYGEIDPNRDIQVILMELILADLQTLQNRSERIEREVRRNVPEAVAESQALEKVRTVLENEQMAHTAPLTDDERSYVAQWHLLTNKKMLFSLNRRSGGRNLDVTDPAAFHELTEHIESMGSRWVLIDAKTEHELNDFDHSEKGSMRGEMYDIESNGVDDLIREGYELLGLITFFTTGEQETRAWQITRGMSAPQAAGRIHGDFEAAFIRAEVISYEALVATGAWGAARDAGKLRLEGKEYIVQDGDVMVIRHGA